MLMCWRLFCLTVQTERFIAPLPLEFEQAAERTCRLSKLLVDYGTLKRPLSLYINIETAVTGGIFHQ